MSRSSCSALWQHKRCSLSFFSDDRNMGVQLSLQRTRHVNNTSVAALSDRVWPIVQLPVNKISVLYRPPLPDHPSPLHVEITTGRTVYLRCGFIGESDTAASSCWFSLFENPFILDSQCLLIHCLPELQMVSHQHHSLLFHKWMFIKLIV